VEEERIKGLMPNFGTYYATWTNYLTQIYYTQPITQFWKMLKFFIQALPRDVKQQLWPHVEMVENEKIKKVLNTTGVDPFDTRTKRNLEESVFLEARANKIWSLMQDLLDEKGYKIIGDITPRRPSKKQKLEVPSFET